MCFEISIYKNAVLMYSKGVIDAKKQEEGSFLVFHQIFVLYIFIFLGWMFGKIKPEMAQGSKIISFLLVNLLLPCKVFSTFSSNFTPSFLLENGATVLISIGILSGLVLLAIPLARLLGKEDYQRRVYRYSFAITNYAYLGYVLIENVLGKSALACMITFCIPFIFYTYTFGYAMLTGKGQLLKKLINPMTAAILLGCASGLTGIGLPGVLQTVASSASSCVGVMSMLLTGLVLSSFAPKELLPDRGTLIFVALRLAALPALMLCFCRLLAMLFPLPAAVYPFAVIMACMPCGLNTVVFPKLVGEDCRPGARMVLYSHLVSMATIPLWMSVLL